MSTRQINITGHAHRVLNVLRFPFMSLQSIDFHERGKNHKENVAAKISEVLITGKIPTISMHHVSVSCFYFPFWRWWVNHMTANVFGIILHAKHIFFLLENSFIQNQTPRMLKKQTIQVFTMPES